jgi:hypothetical protein
MRLNGGITGALRIWLSPRSQAQLESRVRGEQYAALLDHLRLLLAAGDGTLVSIERECRALLGEAD